MTRYDVTELVQLRRQREVFGHSLMEGQAEERRRIAREIHDSTLQLLTGLGLAVGQLKRTQGSGETLNIVADMEQLLIETHREIRSISYLAHPPLLEEMGLTGALQALVEGSTAELDWRFLCTLTTRTAPIGALLRWCSIGSSRKRCPTSTATLTRRRFWLGCWLAGRCCTLSC